MCSSPKKTHRGLPGNSAPGLSTQLQLASLISSHYLFVISEISCLRIFMELKPADFGASKLIHLKFSPVCAKIKRRNHHFALKKKKKTKTSSYFKSHSLATKAGCSWRVKAEGQTCFPEGRRERDFWESWRNELLFCGFATLSYIKFYILFVGCTRFFSRKVISKVTFHTLF